MSLDPAKNTLGVKKVLVLTTAMFSFIPFWQAAAVVLCDFGSSAFYAGSIAMRAFGPAFPWFILGIMLLAGVLLMVYIESCGMFVRSGVYPVVKAGLGDKPAKLAVSAVILDFLLTGPISGVAAGHYLGGLLISTAGQFGVKLNFNTDIFAVITAVLITVYFWRQNVKGISESSGKSAKIVAASVAVCLVLVAWALFTIVTGHYSLPPFKPEITDYALGWAKNIDWFKTIGVVGVIMALGHSVLALSGLETLAQVYREIEYPKIENLKKAAVVIFLFALIFTGGLTFLAAVIIPYEHITALYSENLLSGLVMELRGPMAARLIMQTAVVLVGVAMLSGAVNTSMIGANAVLNRVAEDGILTDWFRKIHKKYGTTYHVTHTIAAAQIIIILLSGGKVYLLGEAYAFGILWSFVLETLSVLVLRFKEPGIKRPFRFPFNINIGGVSLPAGLAVVFLFLFSLASMNLLTKKVATVFGLSFTAFLYMVFLVSERLNAKRANVMFEEGHRENINTITVDTLGAALKKLKKPHKLLVAVKDPENLYHLEEALKNTDAETTDVIVLYSRPAKNTRFGQGSLKAPTDATELFSAVILVTEKYGTPILPLMVESNDHFYAITQVARASGAEEIIMGVSGSHGANHQLERMVMAWGALKKETPLLHPVVVKIIWEGREVSYKFTS